MVCVFILIVNKLKLDIENIWWEILNFVKKICNEMERMIKVCIEVLVKLFKIYCIVIDDSKKNFIKIKDILING